MKKNSTLRLVTGLLLLLCAFSFNANAQCRLLNEPFNVNPVLSPTNVDGAWYPDRYPPSGFSSDVLGGNNVLKIHIDGVNDGLNNRPPSFQSTFYNTQGRKFNQCGSCVTVAKADIWIPSDWATNKRRSDMWATAFDNSNTVTIFPIIGFRNPDGVSPGIYYWDENVGWVNTGVAVVYNSWYTVEFRLIGANLEYYVNGANVASITSSGSTYLGDVMLQAYNFNDPTLPPINQSTDSYDAYWDNAITTGTGGRVVTNLNTGLTYCSIQAAINDPLTVAGHTVQAGPGSYNEDVNLNKAIILKGTSPTQSTISGPIGGPGSTVAITASGATIEGFTITRDGNNTTDWNNPGLNTPGVSIQGLAVSGATIRNNVITGNRTGIDINNSNGHTIMDNVITFNRTGLIFRNQTDNMVMMENHITDNWTVGVLFLDASGGTNSPVQTALNGAFNNNNISSNWYAEIVDRQTGGALPAPGANQKNFMCNWYGATPPVVTNANSAEPGYAGQIPVAYGGTATNPGGAPDIAGPASANFKYTPYLVNGTDNSPAIGFQPVPNSCSGCPSGNVIQNTNTGLFYCTIQSAIDDPLTLNGHTITIGSGNYNEQVLVYKGVKLIGVGMTQPLINFTGTVSGKPTIFDISADAVTVENIHFNVDLSKLRSAIIATAPGIDNVTVKNNVIDAYGTPAGSYGDRNAVSINYGGPANYRVATGGVDNILYQGNTVNGTLPASFFRSAVAVDEGGGLFTGNTGQTINHDVLVRFGSNGPVTVTNNICNGGGVELVDMNAGAGAITVTGNTFNGAFANIAAPGSAVLRLRDNFNSKNTIVNGNTFSGHQWGITMENYNTVTVSNNSFTPSANSTSYHHIVVNTKVASSSSASAQQVTIDANIMNNTFNGSGMNGGSGVTFANHDNDAASFGTFNVNQNSFDLSIANAIQQDNQAGPSNTSTFPNYNLLIGASPATITTMAPWTAPINGTCNWYGSTDNAVVVTKVGPNVTYIPYLHDGTDNSAAIGFQPVPNSCSDPKPRLRTTINGVTVTSNENGLMDDNASFVICNTPNNMVFNSFVDLNGVTPASKVRAWQELVTLNNVTVPFCNNCSATLPAFAGAMGSVALVNPSMSGTLVIRFRAFFDANGDNAISVGEPVDDWIVYTVHVDGQAPVLTVPANASVECDNVPPVGIASVTDDLDQNPTVTYLGETRMNGSCPNNYTLTRTWRATDACGNTSTKSQTINVSDNTAPTITCPPNKVIPFTGTCSYDANPGNTGTPTVSDNCGGVVAVTYTDVVSQCGYNVVITRTWKATDVCNNSATCVQIITATDNNTAYVIYATKEAKFGEDNLINGDVGVTDANGKAEFKKNDVLDPYHVYAKNITVQMPAMVNNKHFVPATGGPNPPFMTYVANPLSGNYTQSVNGVVPAGNYKNLTIKKGVTATINGSNYGKINIEEGCNVTFTSSDINMEELFVGKGKNNGTTNIYFTTCAAVKVAQKVTIEEDCRVNVGGPRVTFYLGDLKKDEENFMVKGDDTQITLNIMVPKGKLKIEKKSDNCIMTGVFIVEKLESTGATTWNKYGCGPLSAKAGDPVFTQSEPTPAKEVPVVVAPQENFQVKVYPNPSATDFSIQVLSISNDPIMVRLMSVTGSVLNVNTTVTKGSTVKLGSELKSGTYFAEVTQGANKQIVKLVKVN